MAQIQQRGNYSSISHRLAPKSLTAWTLWMWAQSFTSLITPLLHRSSASLRPLKLFPNILPSTSTGIEKLTSLSRFCHHIQQSKTITFLTCLIIFLFEQQHIQKYGAVCYFCMGYISCELLTGFTATLE